MTDPQETLTTWKPPPVRVYMNNFYKLQLNAKYSEQLLFSLLLVTAASDIALVFSTPLLHFHFPKFLWWGQRAHWEKKKNSVFTEDKEMYSTDPEQIISLKSTASGTHTHTDLVLCWALTVLDLKTNEPVHTQTPVYTQTLITIYLFQQRRRTKC